MLNTNTACKLLEETIVEDFLKSLRDRVLEEAVEEYRKHITPIVDDNLKKIIEARVSVVRDLLSDIPDLNINLTVETPRETK